MARTAQPKLAIGTIVRRNPKVWPKDGSKHVLRIVSTRRDPPAPLVYVCQRLDLTGKPLMVDNPWHPGTKVIEPPVPYLPSEIQPATLIVGFGVR